MALQAAVTAAISTQNIYYRQIDSKITKLVWCATDLMECLFIKHDTWYTATQSNRAIIGKHNYLAKTNQ